MILRLVIVAYAVGVMLGAVSLIEWLVSRIARLWLAMLAAAVVSGLVGAVGSAVLRWRRRIAR